jgi:hypothetical protein
MTYPEDFEKSAAKLKSLKIWKPFSIGNRCPMQDLSVLTQEERQIALKDIAAWERNVFLTDLMSLAYNIQGEVYGVGGYFSTPIPTIADHEAKAQQISLGALNEASENEKIEIEKINEACNILTDLYLSPQAELNVDNDKAFEIRIGSLTRMFRIHGRQELEKVQARTREKIEVLQEAKIFHEKVVVVYEIEVKSRKSQSSQVIASVVEEAKALIKEAEKLPKVIEKSTECDKKSDTTDTPSNRESAEKYLQSVERFKQLELKYYGLKDRLLQVIAPEHVANKLPEFPKAALIEVSCSFAYLIEKIRKSP